MNEILQRLTVALERRNPLLAKDYLRPGLSPKKAERRFGKLVGNTSPLRLLYAWRDGTEFVQLGPGETYQSGLAKVSFLPVDSMVFCDSERAVAMMQSWKEAAAHQPVLREGVDRYFPLLEGNEGEFMFDLAPESLGRVIFFSRSTSASFYQWAYPSLEEFLQELALANESNSRLAFLDSRKNLARWPAK